MMSLSHDNQHTGYWESSTPEARSKVLGFWLFLAAETVLFACLFASYLSLRGEAMGGPGSEELFELRLVMAATALLLVSSLTSVFSVIFMRATRLIGTMSWLLVTWGLGFAFLMLEAFEFWHYAKLGHTVMGSAFGSSFYTLVGTHGAHVAYGLCWIAAILFQLQRRGINAETGTKVFVATLYWHFIDVIWVFIFSIVYLLGKVGM
ncbi:cytochrome c oxidase subunit 3 [Pasteuria penetrans]|uniref:cytochrome c oxidase subunit 3 n=1 Tax=Pasteuria penetrans TaxID=86005 RepID=UPI000F986143|nr:cytochrome c oxidase subunit 3 [Pasteuria penetrans]